MGCAQDKHDISERSFGTQQWVSEGKNMTIELCIGHCEGLSKTLAGLQNGNECFCANTQKIPPKEGILGNCDMPCERK
jgi:hypothetical protein